MPRLALSLVAALVVALAAGLLPGVTATAYADTYYAGYMPTAQDNAAALAAKKVKFNDLDWYIIEDESTAADDGTLTLLAADNVAPRQKFADSSNAYGESAVKAHLDAMTAEGGSFAGVADAIVATDLTDVGVTGAKLWLLSTQEAYALPSDAVRSADYFWWLRSPGDGDADASAAYVNGSGYIIGWGATVDYEVGVRPALQLDLSKVTFDDTSKTFSLRLSHTHSLTYAASGATVTATCGADGCTLTDQKAELTIVAPTLTTYGQTGDGISEKATLTGLDDFNAATGKTVAETDIKYYKATKSGDAYNKGDSLGTTAPTGAGTYLAEITLSGVKTGEGEGKSVTASVGYTIAKAVTTITTAPTAGEITYGDTLADSDLTGGAGSVAGSFAWKDSTVAPAVTDSQKTEYDVVFTPTDGNYGTAECKVKLTVKIAANPVTYPEQQVVTKTFSTATQTATLEAAEKAEGELSYGIKSQKRGEETVKYFTQNGTTLTLAANTPVGTYTLVVYARAAGDGNYYNGIRESTVTVTVNKAAPTVTAPTAKALTYTGSAQALVTAGAAEGGEMYYSLDRSDFFKEVPTGTDAGDYVVWYLVHGDENHTDTEPRKVVSSIAEPTPTPEPTPEPVVTTTVAKVGRPSAVGAAASRSFKLSWKAADGAKKYQVQWRAAGGKWQSAVTAKGTSYVVRGLKTGTAYELRVRGVNGSTKGAWSTPARRWLKSASKVRATAGKQSGTVKVTWAKDSKANAGHRVYVYAKQGGKAVKTVVVAKGKTSVTIKGLKANKTYYVRMRPMRKASGSTFSGLVCGYRAAKAAK